MSQQNPYRVFVTHAWQENDDYLRVFEFLESARGFFYKNCARPEADPGATSEAQREALRAQIAPAEVVIGLAGLYAKHADLLTFQLTFAQASKKPTLLLRPFGRNDPVPRTIMQLTTQMIEWDERGLVDAIRQHARGEATGRYDTIEFTLD
ncbi:MAG: TIR domain-containing protein [Steroidobacteraceae bacterium]|nr:TIR domain-containing protein [Steroidobacteraceae bacterium]MDW8259192.1 hypothetical protein [Gammaproteobacteria bacterium]